MQPTEDRSSVPSTGPKAPPEPSVPKIALCFREKIAFGFAEGFLREICFLPRHKKVTVIEGEPAGVTFTIPDRDDSLSRRWLERNENEFKQGWHILLMKYGPDKTKLKLAWREGQHSQNILIRRADDIVKPQKPKQPQASKDGSEAPPEPAVATLRPNENAESLFVLQQEISAVLNDRSTYREFSGDHQGISASEKGDCILIDYVRAKRVAEDIVRLLKEAHVGSKHEIHEWSGPRIGIKVYP